MRFRFMCCLAVAALALFGLSSDLWAQQKKTATTITLEGKHGDAHCKEIAGNLKKVEGVLTVTFRRTAKNTLFTVRPRAKATLSPRELWEAVELLPNHTPSKLEGPSGTFAAKPPS